MKKSRFTETQIVNALKRHENGLSVADLARELDIKWLCRKLADGFE